MCAVHCLLCSGSTLDADGVAVVQALLEGAVLCNDSSLNHDTADDGKETWTPNGAPTEVSGH